MSTRLARKHHLTWHPAKLSKRQRAQRLGQRGAVVWFTGLSGSGKSTVARDVEDRLVRRGVNAYVLDGDNIRQGLNRNLGFSPADRKENIRRIGEVAKLFCEANVICLTAFISPYRSDRNSVRRLIPRGRFLEIYCAATLEECEARDPKGLYRQARQTKIPHFTGISAPYESPANPELVLQTGFGETPQQSARKVLDLLQKRGIV